MWRYTLGAIVVCVVYPESRRLFGWAFGYPSVDVFAVLPFLVVLPHIWSLTYGGGWRRLPRPLTIATWLWLGGFGYAFFIALVERNFVPGGYALADFILPMGLGLWIAADQSPFLQAYGRVTRLLFVLTTVISVYGVVQYVVAPEWDKVWLARVITTGSLSFGRPEPFQIRVFSMLASPGPFGNFMALMLLLALPELSLRRPWMLVQIPIWLVAFGLSLDRSGWLLFATGALIYVLMAPRRGTLLVAASVSAALLAGIVAVLPAAIGNDAVVTSVSDRFASFSDLDSDQSGKDRRGLYDSSAQLLSDRPFGHGLGVFSLGTTVGDATEQFSFDSGILARLLEMGIPGVALFLGAFGVLGVTTAQLWRKAGRARDSVLQSMAAVAFAAVMALLAAESSGDVRGQLVMTMWIICGLAMRGTVPVVPSTRVEARLAQRCVHVAHAGWSR